MKIDWKEQVLSKYQLEVLGWGGRRYHRYRDDEEDEEKTHPDQPILDMISGKDEEEEDEYEEKDEKVKPAASHMQEGLQRIVLRDRSERNRLDAVPKISSQEFLIEQAKSPKQREAVRKKATKYIKDPKVIDDLAVNGLEGTKDAAIEKTENKKIVNDLALKGYIFAIKKVTDEDVILDIFKKGVLKQQLIGRSYWEDEKTMSALLASRLKSDKARIEVLKHISEDAKKEIALKTKDKSILKEIALSDVSKKDLDEETYYDAYETDDTRFAAKRIALYKLKDPKVNKEVALNPKQPGIVRQSAMFLLNDKKIYEQIASDEKAPDFVRTAAVEHVDDEKLLKAIVLSKGKKNKYGSDLDSSVREAAISKITDQDFLKEIIKTHNHIRTASGIKDQEFLKDLYHKFKDTGEKEDLLKGIKDQKFLKEVYETSPDTKGETTNERIRRASLKNITDTDFLLKAWKRDGRLAVREAAFRAIKDPKVLADRLMKEKSKTLKGQILNAIKDQQVLKEVVVNEREDRDLRRSAAHGIKSPKVIKDLLENHGRTVEALIIVDDLVQHIASDQTYLKNLLTSKDLDKTFTDIPKALLDNIKDKQFIVKFLGSNSPFAKNNDIIEDTIERIADQKTLENLVLTLNDWGAISAFGRLKNPSQDFLEKVVLEAPYGTVREKALPFIKDKEILKRLAIEDAHLAEKILPHFVDDKEFLQEVLLKSKSEKARANILRRTKSEELLKKAALKEKGGLALKALEKVTDQNFLNDVMLRSKNLDAIKKVLPNVKDPEILKKFVLRKDWKETEAQYDKFDRVAEDALNRLANSGQLDRETLEKLVDDVMSATERKDTRIHHSSLFDYLKDHQDLLQKSVLIAKSPDVARSALSKLKPDSEFAKKIYNEAKNREIKLEALLKFEPKDITPDLVPHVISAMEITHEPNAVSVELLKTAYDIGTDAEKEELKDRLPERMLTEKHKKERATQESPYLVPQGRYEHQKTIKKIEHPVETQPQRELLRLLVQLAK